MARKLDTRPLRVKGVAAVGSKISRTGTMGKIIVDTGKTKAKQKQRVLVTVLDVPAETRTKVDDIRKRYRTWGAQKNSIAASRVIAACNKNRALVNIVMATMLRNKIHTELRNTIRKQMKAFAL